MSIKDLNTINSLYHFLSRATTLNSSDFIAFASSGMMGDLSGVIGPLTLLIPKEEFWSVIIIKPFSNSLVWGSSYNYQIDWISLGNRESNNV